MDSARCMCLGGVTAASCPIHGRSSADPVMPWQLNYHDKKLLRSYLIDPEDSADIHDTRKADEDRYKP